MNETVNSSETVERLSLPETSESTCQRETPSDCSCLPDNSASELAAIEHIAQPTVHADDVGCVPEQPAPGAQPFENADSPPATACSDSALRVEAGASLATVDPMVFEPFPLDAFPKVVREYVVEQARCLGCDPAMVALPALSVLAGAIGNTYRVRAKEGWVEPAILWTVVVGDSGAMKTPALRAALDYLVIKETDAHGKFLLRRDDYESLLLEYEKQLQNWKRGGKGKGTGKPPAKPQPPRFERLMIGDATMEALAMRHQECPWGLLQVSDELAGWFNSFGQYKGGKGGDTEHWLSIYSAQRICVDRKSQPLHPTIINLPCVSVCGGTQPEVLSRVLTPDKYENGMAARLLMAMPPKNIQRWSDDTVDPRVEAEWRLMLEGLLDRSASKIRDGEAIPEELPLSDDARSLFVDFVNEVGLELYRLGGKHAALWSKLKGAALRIALVLELAASSPNRPSVVHEDSMAAGIRLARWFGREGLRIYTILGGLGVESEETQLVSYIRRHGGSIRPRDLQRKNRAFKEPGRAEEALDELVSRGWGHWDFEPAGPRGGSPTRRFVLREFDDPAVDETPADAAEKVGCVDVDTEAVAVNNVPEEPTWATHTQN